MRPLRVYADTSVLGGCFDDEFREPSNELITKVRRGDFVLVISDVTIAELVEAPEVVRELLAGLPPECVEIISLDDEVRALRDAYVSAGVVGQASLADAAHIAAASVAAVDLIVSWNFRHIVHFDKIRAYHGVNLIRGYRAIPIHAPPEVV